MSEQPSPATADVELRVPADGAFVYVLRTTAASVAARLDFTVDDVEDLRIAIGEAASLLLDLAPNGSDLRCLLRTSPHSVVATISTPSVEPLPVVGDSFAWQVLDTLTTSCATAHDGDRAAIELEVRSILSTGDEMSTGALE